MSKKLDKSTGKTSSELTKALNIAVTITSKVLEVAHWIGAVGLILLAIFGFTQGAFPGSNGDLVTDMQNLNIYGFEVEIADSTAASYQALGWFGIGGVLIMITMAMVFRNIYLITKSSREKTPFTEDNMRMVKELGIFFIVAPVISLIFGCIIRITTGVEVSGDVNTILVGLIMLYLTQIFARGVELEDDVKGLI